MTCKERILSNEYADVMIDFSIPEELGQQIPPDNCYHEVDDNIRIYYIRRDLLQSLDLTTMSYNFLPKCYGLMQLEDGNRNEFDVTSLIESGILQVQGQPLQLTGQRVTIGFIDTGIQYENTVFRDAYGRTRITAIWDQTVQEGTPPEGFLYGTEYTQEMIQQAIESENPGQIVPSTDENGHGTAIASVAAGSKLNTGRFIGAAPECEIVVVKLKEIKPYLREYYLVPPEVPCYQENDIIQAIQYLQKYAVSLYRPLVICLGIGTNQGDHSGSSLLGRYLNQVMLQKSRVTVTNGGNEGDAAHHFHGEVTGARPYQNVEIRVGGETQGFVMDFWGGVPFLFSVMIRSPGGETVQWINPRVKRPQEFTFIFERTRLIVDYLLVEQTSGSELIRFRFELPTAGIWNIRVNAEGTIQNGTFDIWLPITQFLSTQVVFLQPDPETTLTDPAYVMRTVSVTAYQDSNNSIYAQSGRGYARDGRVKPDLAAPGVNISTILGNRTGASMAAAITAGGIAQLLQWAVVEENDILADSESIRNYLIRGAQRESDLVYPNREWGYGRLWVEGVFRFLAGT